MNSVTGWTLKSENQEPDRKSWQGKIQAIYFGVSSASTRIHICQILGTCQLPLTIN